MRGDWAMADAPWVEGLTIGQVLAKTARRHGDREALVFPQLGRRSRPMSMRRPAA
jgi:hypothetical protein